MWCRPTFKSHFVPAYPTVPNSAVDEKAYANRTLRELDFTSESNGLKIGGYPAIDLYEDGSFYLLDTPGHAHGHICGLARVSAEPAEFIIMGGDIAHHGGEFRPTKWLPLPENIYPHPLEAPFSSSKNICPGAMFEAIHPNKDSSEPFMQPTGPIHDDAETGVQSLNHFQEFDAQDNVFALIAHDETLYDIIDFYPKSANDWWKKGWKEEGRWRFLKDFEVELTH
jgi:glyoxylase-like metal-dependent hydrolase (beta-lactamase superfamily II)